MMTAKEVAEKLNGVSYDDKNTVIRGMLPSLREAGLTVVYGDSDDLLEMEGAGDEEFGVYGGATIRLGVNFETIRNRCREDDCPYHKEETDAAPWFISIKDGEPGQDTWIIETNIPDVEWFDIMEDGKLYCEGFVFKR
jgi:hypothetical protein